MMCTINRPKVTAFELYSCTTSKVTSEERKMVPEGPDAMIDGKSEYACLQEMSAETAENSAGHRPKKTRQQS